MENFNTEKKAVDSIEKIILDLIDFSNCNKFDFNLYKSFADEKSKSFNRYFFKIEDQAVKEKIISDLESNFHYFVNGIVFKMQSTRSKNGSVSDGTTCIAPLIPDNRISGFENNYNHLIELFLNGIDTEKIKVLSTPIQDTRTKPAPENKHPNMFVNDSFKLFEYILNTHITEKRGRINDISFYYWKMYNDNYIIQKPYPFVEWFTKLYDVESFQMKTLNTTRNSDRLKHYSNSLDWFKRQNQ